MKTAWKTVKPNSWIDCEIGAEKAHVHNDSWIAARIQERAKIIKVELN